MKASWTLACAVLVCTFALRVQAQNYSPRHPEVKGMVDRCVNAMLDCNDRREGALCLVATALLKTDREEYEDHAVIERAKQAARRCPANPEHIYDEAWAIIFLCEYDSVGETATIQRLLNYLLAQQKTHGGFGYAQQSTGDTSQTQYAVLAMWTADKNGIDVPVDALERTTAWLLETQDPSGGWGYQGRVANQGRVKQQKVSLSLTVGGAGSLYVLGNLMEVPLRTNKLAEKHPVGVAVIRPKNAPTKKPDVDVKAMREATQDGSVFFDRNWKAEGHEWPYYTLYAVERFQSFREHAEGVRSPDSPKWYNEGVRYLKEKQNEDGLFYGPSQAFCSSAFAVLFLTRSTRTPWLPPVEGDLSGGHRLPDDLTRVGVDSTGQVRSLNDVKTLADVIESQEYQEYEALLRVSIPLGLTERDRERYLLRRRLENPNASLRKQTVEKMASERSMDNAPALIYALRDSNPEVVREARDGLRFLSRKFSGFGLPRRFDEQQRQAAIKGWKAWYSGLRPSAKYLD